MDRRTAIAVIAAASVPLWLAAGGKDTHLEGVVMAAEGNRVTVKAQDGTTVTVLVTPRTKYLKGKDAVASSELKVGLRVALEALTKGGDLEAKQIRLGIPDPVPAPSKAPR